MVVDLFWVTVSFGGFILGGDGVVDLFWVVVVGGGFILSGGGW